ncbi:hypothetical protein CQW23_12759 [Capsicum baccatum]|uniref:Uncharacterized protein n=1 Tax=Capsicum baccatum TaxID=33114 RepID=A0A2G2WTP1_CAPBA|nr:hypothetical protein CQW23_12759 [Capsicum baccatum]
MISSELVMCPPLHHVPMASSIPVVCVENSGRCNKNELDEKILPNGTAWIPSLLQTITDVVLSESNGILVDQKLIEGPNPNNKGKLLIPLIAAFQDGPAAPGKRIEEASDYFMHAPLGSGGYSSVGRAPLLQLGRCDYGLDV